MIRILHHHLRRGGVTRVMESAAAILRDAGESVAVYSGEPPPGTFPEGVELHIWPELGYRDGYDATAAAALLDRLEQVTIEGDIWHVHNHSLGKSPVVTQALLDLAGKGIPIIFQLHDFAEDGRPANLVRLRESLPEGLRRLYPVGSHIRYAVLQERDRTILSQAGVPDDHLHVLPNPVSVSNEFDLPRVPPERVLYLTRGIRRKNVGEFVFWAWRFGRELSFATSLTPENPVERKTFAPWMDLADQIGVSIEWGIGMDGRSFRDVVEQGDVCLTTSVAEGFGMSFLEPFAMNRAVVGRDLPGITAGFRQDGLDLDALYAGLPVPEDAVDPEFWNRAERGVLHWRKAMGLQGPSPDLRSVWVRNGTIDFAKLDETAQAHVMTTRASDLPGMDLLGLDRPVPLDRNRACIQKAYGPEGYLTRLRELYSGLENPSPIEWADADGVRNAFADPATLTMLRV